MRRQAILLNGPSSGGKSTLARELWRLLQEQGREFGIVSIDDLLEMSPEEPIYEDDVYAITNELGARACGGVIIDQVMTSERMDDGMLQALDGCPTLTVRVACAPHFAGVGLKEGRCGVCCPSG